MVRRLPSIALLGMFACVPSLAMAAQGGSDAYSQAVAPRDCAHRYAREVLDEAYRRAFRTGGQRMQDLAEAGADRDDLTTQFTAIRDELADLWKRAETAASQERNPT